MNKRENTIAAVATGAGGALAVIRLSGQDAIRICSDVFIPVSGRCLTEAKGYTLHYGQIMDGDRVIDDAVISLFRAPHSFTGEDTVEISCHGSGYIQREIMKILIDKGARSAEPGEFTVRAFLSGKIDLSQAEAVADMIASSDRATHAMAYNQMKGGYSAELSLLRAELLTFTSLLELELDFSEEDVEFADRSQFLDKITAIHDKVNSLAGTFATGNALKEGVGVVIIGSPNVGKSTLLNALVKDDRAMVSDIAGTTRDVIEETVIINGIRFRFIDTAGIRSTEDALEKMGIERTMASIDKAEVILYMAEACDTIEATLNPVLEAVSGLELHERQKLFIIVNKIDKVSQRSGWNRDNLDAYIKSIIAAKNKQYISGIIAMSAKHDKNLSDLTSLLFSSVEADSVFKGETTISNNRHYESLIRASESIERVIKGLSTGLATDLVSQDIRETILHIGEITGEITTDNILSSIFSKFCIGK